MAGKTSTLRMTPMPHIVFLSDEKKNPFPALKMLHRSIII